MDLITVGLVGQLIAVVGLAVLVVIGPPEPRQALQVREDGRTERVVDDNGRELYETVKRGLVALFACATLVGFAGLAKGWSGAV